MSLRCPACGFESSAEAKWCDFCKEPFQKKQPKRKEDPAVDPELVPLTGLLSVEQVRKALARDWPKIAEMPRSVRYSLIALGFFVAFYSVGMGILLIWNAFGYHGPGADIELGKPVVIDNPPESR